MRKYRAALFSAAKSFCLVVKAMEISRSGFEPVFGVIALLLAIAPMLITGCAVSAPPIDDTPRVAMTPVKDQVVVSASPSNLVGTMVPVEISIANGTTEPRLLVPSQIFAINEHDQRIIPMPATEAIRAATKANALKAGLKGAAKNAAFGAAAGAVTGGAIGAAVGTIVAEPVEGMALGAALGGAVGGTQGAVVGGVQGQAIAYHDAESQISSLALQQSEVQSDYTVNGYVFFPQGNYKGVQVVLLNQETHQTDTITVPWGGAPGELRDQYADSAPAQSKRSAQTAAQPILPGATVHSSTGTEAPPQPAISSPGVSAASETE
jgi:hypothetical protein